MAWLDPRLWAGWVPNGLGQVKPHHYLEMVRTVWENRDELGFAWRVLRDGVCDGCALGTTGMRDWTMPGVHLCTVRLNLLRLNTMPAMAPDALRDVGRFAAWDNRQLRGLGRLATPMVRRRGDAGFTPVGWDVALDLVATRLRTIDPRRVAFYLTSRGITNEVYYVAQKAARALGTNHVDNSARICHAPSSVALMQSLGVSASTCSYRDWIGTDLIVFFGSDVPNNQPVTTKYLYYAKRRGTRVVVVNPFREPGLERYWVPSVFESAVFGTRLADDFFAVHTGGDRAFIAGVLKALSESGGFDDAFIRAHTTGFDALAAGLSAATWAELEAGAGAPRAEMERFAGLYRSARSAVFVWSMGVTQHRFGVDNVLAIAALALSRGMVGREHCGLMPIRGHSGVQGGAEVGAAPDRFPGGRAVDEAAAADMARQWGFPVPAWRGWTAPETIAAAAAGDVDTLYCIGGNFLETLPDPARVRDGLARVPLRVHHDVVLSPTILAPAGETVVVLPATTRYEQPGGGTETTTERRIVFSPEIPGRRIPGARAEWQVLRDIVARVDPARGAAFGCADAAAIRTEIARLVPQYEGIQRLAHKGDVVQWGGARLCEGGRFPTADGRAHFAPITLPAAEPAAGRFRVSTRRGKQFNSMLWADRDPLTGARRDDVLMSRLDAEALGLVDGERILLRSDVGSFAGRVRLAPIHAGNLQIHWPEGNVLLAAGRVDPRCGIPDYNAEVDVVRIKDAAAPGACA